MRNVYLDYVHHDFGYYFSPEFMEKHINLKASPNLHSAYELGKSLSRISLGQLEARNASGHLSETNVNS
ncbi:MAG TPA: hypothetical protein VGX78_17975, partial [Pirellulales bacterium]|nr:hypothetical protein [Pirellulales bacterium]